ncbi:MAG: endonuclease/exonuclease/phosphatase family protein [Anaerolineae bacterium]|nr:endonuclease/exonuclease/phosphatase family protein [Anaerolineae bacterium]
MTKPVSVHFSSWRFAGSVIVGAYAAGMLAWSVIGALCGDRWPWLFALNTFAPFLFVPLPFALLSACWLRRREVWVSVGVLIGLWGGRYGELWLPRIPAVQALPEMSLKVMTYNALFLNDNPEQVRQVILTGDPDLVAFQELNPAVAAMTQQELGIRYPYQVLDPRTGTQGMGVISKYPLARVDSALGSDWVFTPQVLSVDVDGREVLLLNIHLLPTTSLAFAEVADSVERRVLQTQAICEFVEQHPGALLLVGDFNTTPQSREYALLSRSLHDTWREAGWGLGHTWPVTQGSLRPRLVRIDYVWHSKAFQALHADLGLADGVSDHRPLLATLAWR